jgi:hypothetical protein
MVALSLTSTPPRFKFLPAIVQQLLRQNVDKLFVVIPKSYDRFPGVHEPPELESLDPRVRVLRPEKDLGPGTKFMYTAQEVDDLIVYVDDDTRYPDKLVDSLVEAYNADPCVWGLSGFKFTEYFSGRAIIRLNKQEVDVIEGYGGVIIHSKVLKQLFESFCSMLELTYNDDMILSNLLDREDIPKKTLYIGECHLGLVQQYSYGFGEDALHHNNGEGSHLDNNRKIIQKFLTKDCYYFQPRC